MTNAKRKGSSFERDIAKKLSVWYTGRDDAIWRSHSSGGRATVREKQGQETYKQYGDLSPTHPSAESLFDFFCIELKKGYNIEILEIVDSDKKNKDFVIFVEQSIHQAVNSGSFSYALIFQRDRRKTCIAIPSITMGILLPYIGDRMDDAGLITVSINNLDTVCVMSLDQFLETVSRDDIEAVLDILKRGVEDEE